VTLVRCDSGNSPHYRINSTSSVDSSTDYCNTMMHTAITANKSQPLWCTQQSQLIHSNIIKQHARLQCTQQS